MADSGQQKAPSLAVEYSLPEKEPQRVQVEAPVEKATEEKPAAIISETVVEEKAEDIPAADESNPAAEESNGTTGQEASEAEAKAEAEAEAEAEEEAVGEAQAEAEEAATEQPEIKIETAPADFRFPTTNQTRHCFTRYIEYHRCIAAKGEDASECNKFAKYYRSLCPGEWVERWNEQRENGTFPGPL